MGDDVDLFKEYFAALAPSTGLALLFWLLMRSMLRADRSERAAAQRARDEMRSTSTDSDGSAP